MSKKVHRALGVVRTGFSSPTMCDPGLSVTPFFMANGQPIQFVPAHAPLWQQLVHNGDEVGIVGRLQHVNHLVDDDVFQAFAWFLREIGVQSDAA